MKNKRLFNYRPLLIIFLFLALGTVLAFYLTTKDYIFAIVSLAITIISIITISIIKRKLKYFLIPIISLIIGLSAVGIALSNINSYPEYNPTAVECRIFKVTKETDDYARLYADNVYFDGKKIASNIIVTVYSYDNIYENIEIGNVIEFLPLRCFKNDIFYYGTPNATEYNNRLFYTITTSESSVIFIREDKTFSEKLRNYIYTNLSEGLTNENLEIAYSALFGDKTDLNLSLYNAFKLSGVAHLLAVSGLHVGIIVGFLYKILNLMKIKRWPRVIIIAIFLLIYMYTCGFAISIIRATIMSLVLLIAPLLYKEYDTLSSISLAGIIVILINPLSMFDVSFLLSFACVVGICLMYKSIKNVLLRMHIPKFLSESLALSASTSIALIVIMAYYFQQLNVISLLANIVIIPIFSFVFTIIFIFAILSLIIPQIGYLLTLINPIVVIINQLTNIFARVKFGIFETLKLPYISMLIYFVLILIMSRICLAKKSTKILISLPIFILLIITFFI